MTTSLTYSVSVLGSKTLSVTLSLSISSTLFQIPASSPAMKAAPKEATSGLRARWIVLPVTEEIIWTTKSLRETPPSILVNFGDLKIWTTHL